MISSKKFQWHRRENVHCLTTVCESSINKSARVHQRQTQRGKFVGLISKIIEKPHTIQSSVLRSVSHYSSVHGAAATVTLSIVMLPISRWRYSKGMQSSASWWVMWELKFWNGYHWESRRSPNKKSVLVPCDPSRQIHTIVESDRFASLVVCRCCAQHSVFSF